MATFGGLGIGLSFLCGCVLLAIAAELYYLLWWKKSRVQIENQPSSLSSLSNYIPTHLSYISCFKNPNSSKPTKTHEIHQDPEMGMVENQVLKCLEEESLDLELMRLHNLCGPPRFLTTINEETKEDLESERSKKGSRTRSLSDLLATLDTPFLSPQASPPLKGTELLNMEGFEFNHHGLNPLFEMEINRLRSSPPSAFKFLRDAEEKLLKRLMQLEGETGVNSATKTEEKDGSFVNLGVCKGKIGNPQVSGPSKVLPLTSSPSNNQIDKK